MRLPVNWLNAEWDSPSTESTQSETPRRLSQRRVRLPVDWVNAEWEFTSTESMQSENSRRLNQRRRHKHVEYFFILRWLGWRGVSFRVDSVDVESYSALTRSTKILTWRWLRQPNHRRMLKYSNTSAFCLACICLISAKNQKHKNLIRCTFKLPPEVLIIILD